MQKTLDAAGVKAGLIIGEIGAGSVHFTAILAKMIGGDGKIYANDIDEDSLEILMQKGLRNVETVLGSADDQDFPVHELDMIIIV